MKTHTHWFNQGAVTGRNAFSRNNFRPRKYRIFTHYPITLYAQRLIVFTGIDPSIPARSTFPAIRIRIQRHIHALLKTLRYARSYGFYHRPNLMPRNNRHFHHRVPPQISIQVRTTETYIFNLYQYFPSLQFRLLNLYDCHFLGSCNLNRFHFLIIFIFRYTISIQYFVSSPPVISTEQETNHRNHIRQMIHLFINVHQISRKLGQASITHY